MHTMNGRDGTLDASITINAYGSNHTYVVCRAGNTTILNSFNAAGGSYYPLVAMLYE